MRFWVGVTDPGWYRFHRDRSHDEVNFWQPSERAPFKNLPEGAPFLFKLKGAANAIAGGTWLAPPPRAAEPITATSGVAADRAPLPLSALPAVA